MTNEGGVTSFQRSLLSFHSPMLARSVGKHGRGNKKDDRNKRNRFPGWCWGLARQVGMPPDCQWAFPQAKAHWFASLRCSAKERQTLSTVLLIRWYNIWTCFYMGMCCFYIECVAVCIFRKSLAHSGLQWGVRWGLAQIWLQTWFNASGGSWCSPNSWQTPDKHVGYFPT